MKDGIRIGVCEQVGECQRFDVVEEVRLQVQLQDDPEVVAGHPHRWLQYRYEEAKAGC